MRKILITGEPKSGKSTLLKKVVRKIPHKVGFVTSEILGEGSRLGFEVETHLGHTCTLAHVNFTTPLKVSRYSVELKGFEELLDEVRTYSNEDVLYLDEIGEMELFSNKFKSLVQEYLDSPNILLATIASVFEDDFIKLIKGRPEVTLIEITPENRDLKEKEITDLLKQF